MKKGLCFLGLVIGLFAYIRMAQSYEGVPPVEGAFAMSGLLLLAGCLLPIIVVIIVVVNTTRSNTEDTISEIKQLLKK